MAGMFPDEFPFTPRREKSWRERIRRGRRRSSAASEQFQEPQEAEVLVAAPRMPPVLIGVVWLPESFTPPVITTAPASV
jgi:hypothetical protein